MGHRLLCLSLIVLITVPQVTPLFFDLLGLGEEEPKGPLDYTEEDLETLQIQRLTELQQIQQLRELQAKRLRGPQRRPQINSHGPRPIPLLPISPIPISQLGQLGQLALGTLGRLEALRGPQRGYGRGRYQLLNENGLDREGEPEETESRGILGGLRDTIGALMGFRRSEDEEEFVLPTGPKMEHHIHTYDIIPQQPGSGLPFGVQALNPFVRNDGGYAPYGQPVPAAYSGGVYAGGAYNGGAYADGAYQNYN